MKIELRFHNAPEKISRIRIIERTEGANETDEQRDAIEQNCVVFSEDVAIGRIPEELKILMNMTIAMQRQTLPRGSNAPTIVEEVKQHVNMAELGEKLQQDGLKLFAKSFDDLIELMK